MSPKERFQKTETVSKGWTSIVDGVQFQFAVDMAVLEFHSRMGSPPDMATAAANEWRRQGARDFLKILMELNINTPPPTVARGKELDYKQR